MEASWAYVSGHYESSLRMLSVVIVVVFCLTVAFVWLALGLRLANNRKLRLWTELENRWQTATIAVLAGESSQEALWRLVEPRHAVYFTEFLLRFARRLQGSEREILGELARRALPLFVERLASGGADQRAQAVQVLSILGLPEYEEQVVRALDDPSPLVAMIAARALAREQSAAHAERIIASMSRFGNWAPRFLASMLASLGPEAAPVMRRAFADPSCSPQFALVFAESLLDLHDAQAAELAVTVLETTQDRDVIAACLRLLGEIGQPAHLPVVRPFLDSQDFALRAHAVSALAELGTGADAPAIRTAFDDPSSWVALRAARGLVKMGETNLLKELARSLHPRAALARQILAEAGL